MIPEDPFDDKIDKPHKALSSLRESFAPTYLTLLSILEGVLLSLILERIIDEREFIKSAGWDIWLPTINTVLVIILVWNEYRMGASMYKWVPGVLDSIVPFTLGVVQGILVWSMWDEAQLWVASLASYYSAGVIGYWNMYHRAEKENINQFVLAHNNFFKKFNMAVCTVIGVILWSLVIFLDIDGFSRQAKIIFFGVITVLNLLFLIRGEINWQFILKATKKGIEEKKRLAKIK